MSVTKDWPLSSMKTREEEETAPEEEGITPEMSKQTKMSETDFPAAGPSIFKQTSVQAFVKQTKEIEKRETGNWDWDQLCGLCGE